jgi:hypothetical protein
LTKEQARDALRKAESDVLSAKNGLPTRKTRDIPLSELLNRYLEAKQGIITAKQIKLNRQRCEAIFDSAKAYFLKDLTPEKSMPFSGHFKKMDCRQKQSINIWSRYDAC